MTKVDTRKNYFKQTMETLHQLESIYVFEHVIRVDSSVEWSQDNSIPVVEYRKSSRSAKEYTELAEEVSVGKDSILRAANADAKKTEVKVETKPAEEVKAAAKAEAAPAAKKAPTKKTAAKKTTAARKTTRKAPAKKAVKTSVLTPQNSEELEKAFVKGEQPETVNGPVHIKDELPIYLL